MDYLVWRVWIGIWIVVICTLVVALEGCFLVKYFTRFTEEIFACLISFIFVYEALKFMYEVSITENINLELDNCQFLLRKISMGSDRIGTLKIKSLSQIVNLLFSQCLSCPNNN